MKKILVAFLLIFTILLGAVAFIGCEEPKETDEEEEEEVEVKSVKLNKSEITLKVGEKETLTVTVKPSDATDTDVSWKTSDKKIATVSSKGSVKAIAEGEATITVTSENGKTATCTVIVIADPADDETEESDTEITEDTEVTEETEETEESEEAVDPEESEETEETEESEEIVETEETKATTKPAASAYDVKYYQVRKFLKPVWAGDVCYAEAAFVRGNEQGVVEPIQLLYGIEEIISVRNSALDVVYKEGSDYNITEDGKLEIIPGGKIPVLSYSDYYFPFTAEEHQTNKLSTKFPSTKAGWGYIRAEQVNASNPGMSQWTLAVTYKHAEESILTPPADKSAKFERIKTMLENGESIKMASLGDSITYGWSSSLNANMAPFCPSYSDMVKEYINVVYRVRSDNVNLSVSGQNTNWALTKVNGVSPVDKLCEQNADLIILAFGMNDGCGMDTQTYINNINTIITQIETSCPDACVVVVGTMLPNKLLAWSPGGGSLLQYHSQYVRVLERAEANWKNAAFADVTSLHTEMLEIKSYQDTSGSNSNHPNDYMHRVYAQVIVQTIFGEIK